MCTQKPRPQRIGNPPDSAAEAGINTAPPTQSKSDWMPKRQAAPKHKESKLCLGASTGASHHKPTTETITQNPTLVIPRNNLRLANSPAAVSINRESSTKEVASSTESGFEPTDVSMEGNPGREVRGEDLHSLVLVRSAQRRATEISVPHTNQGVQAHSQSTFRNGELRLCGPTAPVL